ncbi:hypothetical protein [Streptomyces sp. NPDC051636]|uniref:hypothetical protein n=1 Tax=Streptomyces sp. NPDC051636 TaxID=3365663 RepID=UPI003797A597
MGPLRTPAAGLARAPLGRVLNIVLLAAFLVAVLVAVVATALLRRQSRPRPLAATGTTPHQAHRALAAPVRAGVLAGGASLLSPPAAGSGAVPGRICVVLDADIVCFGHGEPLVGDAATVLCADAARTA